MMSFISSPFHDITKIKVSGKETELYWAWSTMKYFSYNTKTPVSLVYFSKFGITI